MALVGHRERDGEAQLTSSQWFDLAVIVVAFVAAMSGWRSGAVGSLMSFVGVVLGAVAGVLLAPHIVNQIAGARTKLFITLFLILGLVVVGEIAGVVLGRAVRGAIRNPALRAVDSGIGVVLQVFAVLVAAWLLARRCGRRTSRPGPGLRGSMICKEVDRGRAQLAEERAEPVVGVAEHVRHADVWQPFGHTPIVPVDAPDANWRAAQWSLRCCRAWSRFVGWPTAARRCSRAAALSVAPNRVMSNAHVVAGANSITVDSGGYL